MSKLKVHPGDIVVVYDDPEHRVVRFADFVMEECETPYWYLTWMIGNGPNVTCWDRADWIEVI
jgi:hypothetical protein